MAFGFSAGLLPLRATATSCATIPSDFESEEEWLRYDFDRSTVVFLGVVASSAVTGHVDEGFINKGTVIVQDVWKGPLHVGDEVAITTDITFSGYSLRNERGTIEFLPDDDQGSPARDGVFDAWLIFASGTQPYELSACSATVPLAGFERYTQYLNQWTNSAESN